MRTDSDRPLIGLSGNFRPDDRQTLLAMAYVEAVAQSGACPLVLPPVTDEAGMEALLSRLDGLVFTGGGDFTPEVTGEPLSPHVGSTNPVRDAFELPLIRKAMDRQMPILGICRGEQLMTLALGGRIYQDIPTEYEGKPLSHSQSQARDVTVHEVTVEPGTLLSRLFPEGRLPVNSFHHQAVRQVPPALRIAARATDGIVEAVESAEFKPFLGVQWHPECLTESVPVMQRLFAWLKEEAVLYHETRRVMGSVVSLDAHCDAPMFFEGDYDIYAGGQIERGKIDFDAQGEEALEMVPARVSLRGMEQGLWDSVVMAAYIKQLGRDEQGLQAATDKAFRLLNETMARTSACPDVAGLARTPDEVLSLKKAGKRAVLLGIENGYALGKDISLVDRFAALGVVYITLSHNGHNDVCDSASEADRPEHHGLSAFGREVVRRMNRCGILVDVSHTSEETFYDAIETSAVPIIASHSSVYALCRHRRNLKDEQIRLLAQKGGVMGICLYHGFLAKDREATLEDAVAHINYVRDLVGVDYVGIGSDFDGGGGIVGCQHSGELVNLIRALVREGYTQEEIEKIAGGNFLRVLRQAQAYALTCQE
ncbi:MAG: membrane dipeptidase [Bacteroidales bacterium]|nr:membrane dipeptidase [Bacteroidales bacterium]